MNYIDLDSFKERLSEALEALTPREIDILQRRFGLKDGVRETLEKIGNDYGVTRECIRIIEKRALNKVKFLINYS